MTPDTIIAICIAVAIFAFLAMCYVVAVHAFGASAPEAYQRVDPYQAPVTAVGTLVKNAAPSLPVVKRRTPSPAPKRSPPTYPADRVLESDEVDSALVSTAVSMNTVLGLDFGDSAPVVSHYHESPTVSHDSPSWSPSDVSSPCDSGSSFDSGSSCGDSSGAGSGGGSD